MNTMRYRGYRARVEFDAADGLFVGHLAGVNDVVGFHADSVAALTEAFHEAVDDYVQACALAGKTPEKPYSGQIMFRVRPETHAAAALAAQMSGVSLNQWAEKALADAARAEMEAASA